MHQRDHLKRIAIISGKETDWAAYKHTKNSLNIAVKISKASYYRNYFLQNKGNIRETWRGINIILSKNAKTTSFPSKLEGINSANLSPNDMSNAFNTHFVEVGPNLGKQISQSPVDFSSFITPAAVNFRTRWFESRWNCSNYPGSSDKQGKWSRWYYRSITQDRCTSYCKVTYPYF